MKICKWNGKVKTNINQYKSKGMNSMDTMIKRPCTILESIEKSFKQIEEYKQGKRKFKSLKESQKIWDEWANEPDENSK